MLQHAVASAGIEAAEVEDVVIGTSMPGGTSGLNIGRLSALEELTKVLALTVMGVLMVMLSVFLLSIGHRQDFLDVAFEATSALGTVGLSAESPLSSTLSAVR